jgi:hypothetical protein
MCCSFVVVGSSTTIAQQRMKKLIQISAVAFGAFVFVSISNAAPVVMNGSFEADVFNASGFGYSLGLGSSNTLTGWTTLNSPDGIYPWGLQNANAFFGGPTPYGDQWVVVGDFGFGGSWIQQMVSGFTVGQTYTLKFALASESNPGSLLEVSFPAGSSTSSATFTAPLRGPNFWDTWDNFSMNFVADATDVTVRFEGLAGPGLDAGIDNVSVAAAVPDQCSTVQLAGLAMLGLGALGRKLRKKQV